MNRTARSLVAAAMILPLAVPPASAQQPAPAEQQQPKALGFIGSLLLSTLFDFIGNWARDKLRAPGGGQPAYPSGNAYSGGGTYPGGGAYPGTPGGNPYDYSPLPDPNAPRQPSGRERRRQAGAAIVLGLVDALRQRFNQQIPQQVNWAPAQNDVIMSAPDMQVPAPAAGQNYQRFHVRILRREPDGRLQELPLGNGLATGDRFKLQVVSSFEALMRLENITPTGQRKPLYPASPDQIVSIAPEESAMLPVEDNEFFEMHGATGEEFIEITVRDPRGLASASSQQPAYRTDEPYGTNMAQLSGQNAYPAFTQRVAVRHTPR